MITTVLFDLGGVIITLDPQQAVRRFQELGVADADQQLDSYTQSGIFGDLEHGLISADEFRVALSRMVGHEVSMDQCHYAWQGYAKEVPERNLQTLLQLRRKGYRVLLLSNTNPCMMAWVESPDFDGHGHPLSYYMDRCYLSYQLKLMKPSEQIFKSVLQSESLNPEEVLFVDDGERNIATAMRLGMHTFCPTNGADWTVQIWEEIDHRS